MAVTGENHWAPNDEVDERHTDGEHEFVIHRGARVVLLEHLEQHADREHELFVVEHYDRGGALRQQLVELHYVVGRRSAGHRHDADCEHLIVVALFGRVAG